VGIKSFVASTAASFTGKIIQRNRQNAILDQTQIFLNLIKTASDTVFGKKHQFNEIKKYSDFINRVPVVDYESMRTSIERIKGGEQNILWPGRPKYFAKTSGTTSGTKYIPMTKESTPHHFSTARDAALNYIYQTGNGNFFDGKMLYLSGSPHLDRSGPVPTGRLSGIANHEIPSMFRLNQLPPYKINCIDDWESKIDAIIGYSIHQDIRMISGIPSWIKMYIERVLDFTGKSHFIDVYPNLSLYIYGGVNYEPYRRTIESLIGKSIDTLETFPASEGFFAFQDDQFDTSLLLNTKAGIFYEFIRSDEINSENPNRLNLSKVATGVPYALIVSTNAGLWAYNTGDVIEFTSIKPYKIKFAGRTSHYISAFGEHVIASEVESALTEAAAKFNIEVGEFTVAPQVNPPEGSLPYHEWFIESRTQIPDLKSFTTYLDQCMVQKNIYYKDLIEGSILRPLVINTLPVNTFNKMMKERGKLGAQNKVPRLTNDRQIAEELIRIKNESTQ
jgi:hypothetical protein